MAFQCKNVVASSHSAHNLSRHELLQWVNDSVGGKFQKVEALCSGAVYCQLLNNIFPGCIDMKKVKQGATQPYEYIHNLKLLQQAFRLVKCDKEVSIDLLIGGRFQDNFEFLQWFKRFYDANADVYATTAGACQAGAVKKPFRAPAKKDVSKGHSFSSGSAGQSSNQKQLEMTLKSELAELQGRANLLEEERDFYFKKLRNIELLCTEEGSLLDRKILAEQIMEEICATEEGFEVPKEEVSEDNL